MSVFAPGGEGACQEGAGPQPSNEEGLVEDDDDEAYIKGPENRQRSPLLTLADDLF